MTPRIKREQCSEEGGWTEGEKGRELSGEGGGGCL